MTSPTRRQIARELLRQAPSLEGPARVRRALGHVRPEATEQYILQQPDDATTQAAVNATRISPDTAEHDDEEKQ